LNCNPWTIENKLHYVCEITLGETAAGGRVGGGAVSGLRNAALIMIRRTRSVIPDARKNFCEDRAETNKIVIDGFLE